MDTLNFEKVITLKEQYLYGSKCLGVRKPHLQLAAAPNMAECCCVTPILNAEFAAWLIQHGSGHNAAIDHSDEISAVPDKLDNQKVAKEGNDLMTSGKTSVPRDDKGKEYREKVGPNLRALFTRKKFTNNAAQDNLKR